MRYIFLIAVGSVFLSCAKGERVNKQEVHNPESLYFSSSANAYCNKDYTEDWTGVRGDSVFLYAPNVFTPNGDGLNDQFEPVYKGLVTDSLMIYKGNKLVYHVCDSFANWDGMNYLSGKAMSEGVYGYECFLSNNQVSAVLTGKVSLIHVVGDKYRSDGIGTKIANCEDCIFGDMIDTVSGPGDYVSWDSDDLNCQ